MNIEPNILFAVHEGAPFVGHDGNDHNLLQKGRPLIMRLQQPFANSASSDRIAAMEWAIGAFLAAMLGLYIWSHVTAGHAIGKRVQPFIDDVFGVGPKTGQNPKDKDHR
jgi:hypothetical protein